MSLKDFIKRENTVNRLFGRAEWILPENPRDLTAENKKDLAQRLLSALSPEVLTCDGELRGVKLRAKTMRLNLAKMDLEALGQKVEWGPMDFG